MLCGYVNALAHGFAGARFFPATIATDDPFMNDEGGFAIGHIRDTSGDPTTQMTGIDGEWAKRITPHFGVTVGGGWQHLEPKGKKDVDGFNNLELGAKYQFLTSDRYETIMSIGVDSEVGD